MIDVKCKDGIVKLTQWQAGLLFTGTYIGYDYNGTMAELIKAIREREQLYKSLES